MKDYEAALHFIRNLTKFGINLGLGRIRELLRRLDNPQEKIKVIHIGGTNGKGSTSAILQAILQRAGLSVGMFTSPHLQDYRERIRINQTLIPKEEVGRIVGKMRPVLEDMLNEGLEHPTEFEVSTALALCWFAEEKPDYVIMEVGLGGEIDSTNVVWPLVSVLTSIGMDHMDYLGNSLKDIARVKSGIIKRGVPVVTSVAKAEALREIEQAAKDKGCSLVKIGQDVLWEKDGLKENAFHYRGLNRSYDSLELALLGEHQYVNASCALAVCELLAENQMISLTESAVREGLRSVRWPARLELLGGKPKILLDGAHNVDGMLALAKALRDYQGGPLRRNKLILCMGMLQDKEIDQAVSIIAPLADRLIVTKPDSPRAGDWSYPARSAEKYLSKAQIITIEDPFLAVETGLKEASDDDLFCITGSLYLIAAIRKYLLERLEATSA